MNAATFAAMIGFVLGFLTGLIYVWGLDERR